MKVGEDEVRFSGVSEHVIFFEFEGCEESIVPDSVDNFE